MNHPMTQQASRTGGFTLVEMLVVMAIAVTLLAIGVLSLTAIGDGIARRRTIATLHTLQAIADEYEVVTTRKVDTNGSTTPVDSIERFVNTVKGVDSCATMLRSMQRDAFGDFDGSTTDSSNLVNFEVVDGWGRKIVYLPYQKNGDSMPTNFATTGIDDRFPESPTPYFVSLGKDGLPGIVSTSSMPKTATHIAQARDNLYSTNLD